MTDREAGRLRVRRWKRYGHDRLYVSTPAGETLGYLDLKTNRGVGVEVARSIEFWVAVDAWRAGAPQPVAPTPPKQTPPVPANRPTMPEPPDLRRARLEAVPDDADPADWVDLAANRPGAAARAVADQKRTAHPVRTRLGRLLRLRTDETAWRTGAKGETVTGRALARLTRPWWVRLDYRPQRWHVLHAVPIGPGDADLDHLVIGPGGVFTINTKTHRGKTVWVGNAAITINRHPTDYLAKANAEANRASKLLTRHTYRNRPVVVMPLIAVVGGRVTGAERAQGVTVLPVRRLTRWLRWRTMDMLTPEQADEIYAIARRSTTWTRP